ncbi:MAG: alanine--tRNA ligase [Bacteroidota bacterium]
MNPNELRQAYLDFFASKGHVIVPSAPLVIKDDPTLMFTNAGMNPFKDVFIGAKPVVHARIADSQKCLRVSGKHNDLEEVGIDTYHHTLFEMLGNWSFGDYFKQEAIDWAWEFLTQVCKLEKDRLYVTVFGGDQGDGLASDEEAKGMWLKHISPDRILYGSKKDNFWEMGDSGPCGPCSEIHVDLRGAAERLAVDGATLVNNDDPQVIEIWNLVFMQFERKANGSLVELPAQHVDTGMGFERLARAVVGASSNYDTEVFKPYLRRLEALSGLKYGAEERTDIAMRVASDHIRAVAFAIADGQLPASNGAGYVIRRILRRAIRYGYSTLGFREPFMAELVPVMVDTMGAAFSELPARAAFIQQVIREEELAFLRTLESGLKRLDASLADSTVLSGERAFELYDTFGFPLDLTSLICREQGKSVDEQGFAAAMEAQKSRSRQASAQKVGDWTILSDAPSDAFVGYDVVTTSAQLLRYRSVETAKGLVVQACFSPTPFYPEGGGQVGDQGWVEVSGQRIAVRNTTKETGMILHHLEAEPAQWTAEVTLSVDSERRSASAQNHSATHLLHHALRSVLGTHVEQRGSLVSPETLRFDFSHFQKVTADELDRIEAQVSVAIRANHPLVERRSVPIAEAKALGAMALFGEKYGESVRVIQFGPSVELCGGTHVAATGMLAPFVLVSESSVASGVRRIEALSGASAEAYLKGIRRQWNEVVEEAKNANPAAVLNDVRGQVADLKKKLEAAQRAQAAGAEGDLLRDAAQHAGLRWVAAQLPLGAAAAKDLVFSLTKANPDLVILVAIEEDGKAQAHLAVGAQAVAKVHSGNWVRELGAHIQGGGGGQDFYASAGGKNPAGIPNLLTAFHEKWQNLA